MRRAVSYHAVFLLCGFLFLNSCMDEELWLERNKPNLDVRNLTEQRGVIILNEGNFTYGNTSLTYYNIPSGNEENDVFYRQNGVPLGDVAHSATLQGGLLYVVINNSGKVIVMNMGKYPSLKAFEFTGKITGLVSPRFLEILSESKAYISDLYARKISVFDPRTLKITGSVQTGDISGEYYRHPTEQMISYGDFLFTNSYSFDDQILIINTITDEAIDSIRVLKQPSSMVADKNNKLWVICDGGYQGSGYRDENAGLVRIDMETRTIERVFIFKENEWPRRLCINGTSDTLYFINGDIWRMGTKDENLPEKPFIAARGKLFYSLGIDDITSDIYAGDAINYVQPGVVYRYNAFGEVRDTINAGVNPGGIVFVGGRKD